LPVARRGSESYREKPWERPTGRGKINGEVKKQMGETLG